MNKKIIIYGLFDPRNGDCFYIGKTINDINYRLSQHLRSKNWIQKINKHKINKIKQIENSGYNVVIKELLIFDDYFIPELDTNYWKYVEMYFIKFTKETLGEPLTNITKGGDADCSVIMNKKIDMYSLSGDYICTYNSMKEAAEKLKLKNGNLIGQCCMNNKKSAGGYQWKYTNSEKKILKYKRNQSSYKPVLQFTKDNIFIKKYEKIKDAVNELNLDSGAITNCCQGKKYKSVGGYIWKYEK